MSKLLFPSIFAAALTLFVGCEKTENVAQVGPEARLAISQAAVAKYPGNPRTSRDIQLAAINYPDKGVLEIHNLGTQSIPAWSRVWVNGTFTATLPAGIAPKSFAAVKHGELLEAGPATNDLKALNQPVAKVEMETDTGLFTVQGPTVKND
jgi:hypothetical protein